MKNMLKNYFFTFLTKIYISKLLTLKGRLVLNEIMILFVHSLLKYKKYYSLGKLYLLATVTVASMVSKGNN